MNLLGDSVTMGEVIFICLQVYLVLEIRHVNKGLNNHVTDTNKKIDALDQKIDRKFENQDKRFDKQDEKFDRQDKRFDDLYQFLLKNKKSKDK